jgi:hypothetical protein
MDAAVAGWGGVPFAMGLTGIGVAVARMGVFIFKAADVTASPTGPPTAELLPAFKLGP